MIFVLVESNAKKRNAAFMYSTDTFDIEYLHPDLAEQDERRGTLGTGDSEK